MKRALMVTALLLTGLSCENGGVSRTVGITASGTVQGQIYFDANASGTFDAADSPVAGAGIRLIVSGGTDTLVRATTTVDGRFQLRDVPVGAYTVLLDSASAGDTAQVVAPGSRSLNVLPGDSIEFIAAISYPVRTIAQARALAPAQRIFVRGVALHSRETFSDTTVHLVDPTGAMRATRVRPSAAAAGDSVVMRARIASRAGQVVLDDVTIFVVGSTFIPPAPTITSAAINSGGGAGARDAALVSILDAQVIDTATVAGNLHLNVNDGSGIGTVILDRAADIAFRVPFAPGAFAAGARYDLAGVLVPTGPGAWALKPRSVFDLTRR